MKTHILEICTLISGLYLSKNYKRGEKLLFQKTFEDNQEFFQSIFEVGRRYKIQNPDKMRNEYGKMLYLLQDSVKTEVYEKMKMSLVKPIKSVYSILENANLSKLFFDSDFLVAIGDKKSDSKTKDKIIKELSKKYANDLLNAEKIEQCLLSIGDSNSFIESNVLPITKMIQYLKKYFKEEKDDTSLTIRYGEEGSCLSHGHSKQFLFVLQSLTLWEEVTRNMYALWSLTEQDLMDPELSYRLRDTGQGLNRMQFPPRVSRGMGNILSNVQSRFDGWVGLSVVHLGDVDVPNALFFIDKYSQIPRIVQPIVLAIESIDEIYKDKGIKEYIDTFFDGTEGVKKVILRDFFRHGFDGSGDDGGSCIDGRLTSAWNWCSLINKKPYYSIFKMAGFVGFDGKGFEQ